MQNTTEPKYETIVYVFGNPVKVTVSPKYCMNAFRQLMLAETYPELSKVNGDTVRRTKKARKSSD